MNTPPFVIERTFDAPVEQVWKAITDKDQMKQWYFDLAEFRPEVGFEFQFEGGDEKQTWLHLCRISEVIYLRRLKHSWRYDGQQEETWVTWDLSEVEDGTRVKLTHEGLEGIAHHGPAFAKQNFENGWTEIVGTSLKNFLEKQ